MSADEASVTCSVTMLLDPLAVSRDKQPVVETRDVLEPEAA